VRLGNVEQSPGKRYLAGQPAKVTQNQSKSKLKAFRNAEPSHGANQPLSVLKPYARTAATLHVRPPSVH